MTVDHFNPEPKYRQIAAIVREQIRSGELEPLQTVPSETQMVQAHGVARETVRQAMQTLRDEGWVFTIQARGTFVSPSDQWPTDS
ncbi:winged helix-turn-helix domain-containing protein [Streptosporangium subroseum]|uniref:GntR family transcriptional regulator n=1 Tax=Streptosporangium subroseum TaxID=106412 RepID=UPI003449E75E